MPKRSIRQEDGDTMVRRGGATRRRAYNYNMDQYGISHLTEKCQTRPFKLRGRHGIAWQWPRPGKCKIHQHVISASISRYIMIYLKNMFE